MATQLKEITLTKIALCAQGANSEAHIQLFKNQEGGPKVMNYEELRKSLTEDQLKILDDEIAKAKCDAKAEGMKEGKEEGKKEGKVEAEAELNKSTGKMTEEELLKSMDPGMAEMYKSMKAQKEAAEALAKSALEEKIENDAIAKTSVLKSLPGEASEIKELYKSLMNTDSKIANQVIDILSKANSAIEESELLKSKGSDAEGSTIGSSESAWSEIEKAATDMAKSEKISIAKATDKVIKENPALYKKYIDAMRAE
ncbi:MAG: hypothetical protein ACRCX2_30130 [Paraclostridium sp.]